MDYLEVLDVMSFSTWAFFTFLLFYEKKKYTFI